MRHPATQPHAKCGPGSQHRSGILRRSSSRETWRRESSRAAKYRAFQCAGSGRRNANPYRKPGCYTRASGFFEVGPTTATRRLFRGLFVPMFCVRNSSTKGAAARSVPLGGLQRKACRIVGNKLGTHLFGLKESISFDHISPSHDRWSR